MIALSPIALLWLGAGVAAGAVHARLLRCSARRNGRGGAFAWLGRLALVAATLGAAAFAGHLLLAAVGWFVAFLATGAWTLWRWS